VRQYDEAVVDLHVRHPNLDDSRIRQPVRAARQPLGKRRQNRGRSTRRVKFERGAAGEHQHDDRAREIFAEDRRSHDGDAGQSIGSDLEGGQLLQQIEEEGSAGDQHRDQRPVVEARRCMKSKSRHEVDADAEERCECDPCLFREPAKRGHRFRIRGIAMFLHRQKCNLTHDKCQWDGRCFPEG
jgi:hypothetical protein